MNKPIYKGCAIVLGIFCFLLLLCGIFGGITAYKFVNNNYELTRNMIGTDVPKDFIPLFSMDLTASEKEEGFDKISFLYKDDQFVALIEGKPLLTKEEKDSYIQRFIKEIGSSSSSKYQRYKGELSFDGEIQIQDKTFDKYKLVMDSYKDSLNGIVVFLNYNSRTITFICLGKDGNFKPQVADEFLDQIKLP